MDIAQLQEIKSHVDVLSDIEFKQEGNANSRWFHNFPNQYSRFTTTQNGRFVWRFVAGERLMVVDLILGVTKILKIAMNADTAEVFMVLCFTYIEDDWGFIIFSVNGAGRYYVAKAFLDTGYDLLNVDFSGRAELHNLNTIPYSMGSIDWWPKRRVAIALLGSLTAQTSVCHVVNVMENGQLTTRRLTGNHNPLTSMSGPQILKRGEDEVMVYKTEDPLMITVFGEQKGRLGVWTENKWNSKKHIGFMKRYKCVNLDDSNYLFIKTTHTKEDRSPFPRRTTLREIPRVKVFSFCLFNTASEQFREIKISKKLLSLLNEGQNRNMFLDRRGILTILSEKNSNQKGHKKISLRRISLRKPDQLVNMAAIQCIKRGIKAEQFPLQYANMDPFEEL